MTKLTACNRSIKIAFLISIIAFSCAVMMAIPSISFADEPDEPSQAVDVGALASGEQAGEQDEDAIDDDAQEVLIDDDAAMLDDQSDSKDADDSQASDSQAEDPAKADDPVTKPESASRTDADKADPDEPALVAAADTPKFEDTHVNVYRVYNPNTGEHFFTTGLGEAKRLASVGWQWEGIGWVAPKNGAPVYRLYNPNTGDHHYTTSAGERDVLAKKGWRKEGISWYSDGSDQKALYRLYNPNAKVGTHMITTSKGEYDALGKKGWRREGISGYVSNGANISIGGFWLVTSSWGSLDRYWVASNGNVAKNRLIQSSEGAGYLAYAKGNGAVVRGAWDNGKGYVYLASQNGKLASTSDGKDGWIVSKEFGNGMQRYYYVSNQHAARTGFFTLGNNNYYGCGGVGFVARGKYKRNDVMLLADNNGVLQTGTGWLVSKQYDTGLQRYWLVKVQGNFSGAKVGLFTAENKKYYGDPNQGFVVRSDYVYSGRWYKADANGVLKESESPQEGAMILRAQGMSSRTNTLILVDTNGCNFGVFTGSKGNWKLVRYEKCVTGTTSTPTIKGTYSISYHLSSLPAWPNALYCTNITGGYFFHSVLSSTSELGKRLSHGCVRLNWPTAQYVQSLPYGSTVNLY